MTSSIPWPDFSSANDAVDQLVLLSRYYGSDAEMVLAGGGNTSVKIGDRLFVKGSGSALAVIKRDGFVEMDRVQLDALANATLSSDREAREASYKSALYAARLEPERNQRPSVEALLHHLMPGTFVVHGHATVANAVTCCAGGEQLAKAMLGDDVLWIPFVDPGFVLALVLKEGLIAHRQRTGRDPRAVLMANHGIIVAGDTPTAVREACSWLLDTISKKLHAAPAAPWANTARRHDADAMIALLAPTLRGLLAESATLPIIALEDSAEALAFVNSDVAKASTMRGPLSPDQIVYCNSYPLWFSLIDHEDEATFVHRLRTAIAEHKTSTGFSAKVIAVPGVGIFNAGDDSAGATNCRLVYLDAVRVMTGAARLSSVQNLSDEHRRFIENWEVEAYRKQIAKMGKGGRASGRIAIVTGAAQGFGLEIAQSFAAEGGIVVLADMNLAGATAAAAAIQTSAGSSRALAAAVDVANSNSVSALMLTTIRTYGGVDVFISNAGVLKAGSVKTQSVADFDFVTTVNYKGFFVCTQHVAPILSRQHAANPAYRSDIIQINSKSGLAGSNKNGAYAGSKFGGIGLVQSFALELIDNGIKVNAVCPGNFFEGPLWSDPATGLFMQYLRAGKVPGATSISDVKKYYEEKVPMGRGCHTADVMKAVFYLIDQAYETGQALPVTGGQVMLH